MKTLARITAIVLIVLGIVVMLSSLAIGVTGAVRGILGAATVVRAPRANLTGLLVILLVFAHGLFIMGAGEGLYLVAGLANKV